MMLWFGLDAEHPTLQLFFSRSWWVRQHLYLHRRWNHRVWWRACSRHSCGVHLWCSWGYDLPVNSLPYFSNKKKSPWISVCFLWRWHRIWIWVFLFSPSSPPFSSIFIPHRFLRTRWKLLTIVRNWNASKTSKRTSNWWATLRVTSRNVRICTEMAWWPVACFSCS